MSGQPAGGRVLSQTAQESERLDVVRDCSGRRQHPGKCREECMSGGGICRIFYEPLAARHGGRSTVRCRRRRATHQVEDGTQQRRCEVVQASKRAGDVQTDRCYCV